MACDTWLAQLDPYLDGQLESSEANALSAHLRTCATCAAEALERVQMKRAVSAAGMRYQPSAELRVKIAKMSGAKRHRRAAWYGSILAVPAALVLILTLGVNLYLGHESSRRQRVYSELADLHVVALASSTPVDVLSSDRHTVKPWFQGKIPFSFNLPELQGSDFTLVGGRVTYLSQSPGAQLIYELREHEISVFIFQDRGGEAATLPSGLARALTFTMETWTQNGLRYFVVGDVGGDDIQSLSKLIRGAG